MPDKADNFAALGLQNAPEVLTPVQLPINGSLPSWLTGTLYRTGPGTYRVPTSKNKKGYHDVSHWFDGIGMHHKFEIRNNGTEVWYQCRKSAEGLEQRIAAEGKNPFISFAQSDPCENIFARFFTFFSTIVGFGPKDTGRPDDFTTCVTIAPALQPSGHSNETRPATMIARTDANNFQIIDADTLQPLQQSRYKDVDPRLSGDLAASHGCTDHTTGDYFNYNLKFGREATYVVFGIRGGLVNPEERERVDVIAEITDAPPAYIHSIGMTEKYVVLCVWQADITAGGISILWHYNLLDALNKKWDNDRPTFYYVIDKQKGGVVAKFKSNPFFAFHTINAFDDGEDVVLDLAVLPTHDVLWNLSLNQLRDPAKYPIKHTNMAAARRIRLPNISKSSSKEFSPAKVDLDVPLMKGIELPTVHPGYAGKRYRYAYGISKADQASTISDRLIKLDMDHPHLESTDLKEGAKVWIEPHVAPGEPIFIPDPNGTEEDDGVVVSVVLDGKVGTSMMLVLNAKDMKEIGRAVMDSPFPFGFHGSFVP